MAHQPKIYTRTGDDGTTGLLYGGRVRKDDPIIELNGAVDEAQAALGLARAEAGAGSELDELVVALQADLWVLMAEVATLPANRHKLVAGSTLVSAAMVDRLEARIDDLLVRFEMPAQFVVPGQNRISASLDLARTVVRRAERLALCLRPGERVPGGGGPGGRGPGEDDRPASQVGRYLNRLSDLCWALARWQEHEHLLARSIPSIPSIPSTPSTPSTPSIPSTPARVADPHPD